jgi:hypothetical protein
MSTATASHGCRSTAGTIASFNRRKCQGPLNSPDAKKARNASRASRSIEPRTGLSVQPRRRWDQSDSLHSLVSGQIVELRVPYPTEFFAKDIDGRIDDPNAGWKRRGLWATTSGNRTPVHVEGIDLLPPGPLARRRPHCRARSSSTSSSAPTPSRIEQITLRRPPRRRCGATAAVGHCGIMQTTGGRKMKTCSERAWRCSWGCW